MACVSSKEELKCELSVGLNQKLQRKVELLWIKKPEDFKRLRVKFELTNMIILSFSFNKNSLELFPENR